MSMRNLTSHFSTKQTPQSEPIPGRESEMKENHAGGFAFEIDKWTRLQRWLILGSEGGSYYASERQMTKENAGTVMECLKEDARRLVDTIVEISDAGRAPKNDPALFALAMVCKLAPRDEDKHYAYRALPKVARFSTDLFSWAEAIKAFGGYTHGFQKAVAAWYVNRDFQLRRLLEVDHLEGEERKQALRDLKETFERMGVKGRSYEDKLAKAIKVAHERSDASVALQIAKYQGRNGWTHADMLRLAKPGSRYKGKDGIERRRASAQRGSALDHIFGWATGKWAPGNEPEGDATDILWAFERAKAIGLEGSVTKGRTHEIVKLITDYRLPREMVPTEYLNEVAVWEALLYEGGKYGMPMTALIRNLGKMTSVGLLKPMSEANAKVIEMLTAEKLLKHARVHPLKLLVALNTYKSGRGVRGSLSWSPVSQIVDALDKAFYLSFQAVEPTNLRWMLSLDVSGSMDWDTIAGMPGITPRIGSAAMAMITAAVEPQHVITAFSHQMVEVQGLSPRMRLDSVVQQISRIGMGGTDCSLPMRYALQHRIPVDVFVVYTDNETWRGHIHPVQALREYRDQMGIASKLIVVGMTATEFSIADPKDAGMLDVIGFDVSAPKIMSEFALGHI